MSPAVWKRLCNFVLQGGVFVLWVLEACAKTLCVSNSEECWAKWCSRQRDRRNQSFRVFPFFVFVSTEFHWGCSGVINVQLILKETGGMFKGILKKTPNPFARTQSQVSFAPHHGHSEIDIIWSQQWSQSVRNDSFFGLQDDLSAPSEPTGTNDNTSLSTNTKVRC